MRIRLLYPHPSNYERLKLLTQKRTTSLITVGSEAQLVGAKRG